MLTEWENSASPKTVEREIRFTPSFRYGKQFTHTYGIYFYHKPVRADADAVLQQSTCDDVLGRRRKVRSNSIMNAVRHIPAIASTASPHGTTSRAQNTWCAHTLSSIVASDGGELLDNKFAALGENVILARHANVRTRMIHAKLCST